MWAENAESTGRRKDRRDWKGFNKSKLSFEMFNLPSWKRWVRALASNYI